MKFKKFLAMKLIGTMTLSLVACNSGGSTTGDTSVSTEQGQGEAKSEFDTMVVGVNELNGIFNPFFYSTAFDSYIFGPVFSQVSIVDDDNNLVGIVTRVDIFKAFIDILGVKVPGTRISLKASDNVGELAEISQIIANHNINIKNISNFATSFGSEVIIKLDAFDTNDLINDLRQKGYEVLSVSTQN